MSILVKNGTLVTMDAGQPILKGDLLVEGNRITGLGKLRDRPETDHVIDASNCLVIPGFIQTHVHLAQMLFRGLADDLTLLDWLKKRIWPMEAALTADDLYISAKLGLAEMLLSGTTSIVDFGSVHYEDAILKAMGDMGIRGKSGKIMMDLSEGSPEGLIEDTSTCISKSENLIKGLQGSELVEYAVTPRFAVTSTDELLIRSRELADKYGVSIQTHAAENREEVNIVKNRTGYSNIEYFRKLGFLGSDVILAHGIWLNETDMWHLKETHTNIAHCPGSNMKLASGTARISEMNGYGINVTLGSDGAPCNNTMDMFSEMRLASLLQKVDRLDATSLPAHRIMKMATVNGATAMGKQGELGVLKEGALADIAVVSLHSARLHPQTHLHDPLSTLVYSCQGSDVKDTIVNGKILVRDGKLVGVDLDKLLNEADRASMDTAERAGITPL